MSRSVTQFIVSGNEVVDSFTSVEFPTHSAFEAAVKIAVERARANGGNVYATAKPPRQRSVRVPSDKRNWN